MRKNQTTRKLLTGSTVSAAVTEFWGRAMAGVQEVSQVKWIDALAHSLQGSAMSIMMGALIAYLIGTLVNDKVKS